MIAHDRITQSHFIETMLRLRPMAFSASSTSNIGADHFRTVFQSANDKGT